MTATEKAKELVRKYWDLGGIDVLEAKQCALIAVEFAREFITGDLSERFDKTMYLLEVKEELLKL
jgi:hypothetical protein